MRRKQIGGGVDCSKEVVVGNFAEAVDSILGSSAVGSLDNLVKVWLLVSYLGDVHWSTGLLVLTSEFRGGQ